MDKQQEYHDPDYPEVSAESAKASQSFSAEEKVEKIRDIIRREFSNELDIRENEVMQIDQRMQNSRRLLGRLRLALVTRYYQDQRLQMTASQVGDEVAAQHEPRARAEVTSLLRDGQRRLHPSVRKLLGKQTVSLDEILLKSRSPRAKARKDYYAVVQNKNYTIAADSTTSLRPYIPEKSTDVVIVEGASSSKPKKVPRHLQPKITKVMTVDEAIRNQMKHRYRFIIGNTSKYAPAASAADRSTHKWLLYVRLAAGVESSDPGRVLREVTVRLHHSYAPHHTVRMLKPPFHVSRRGWGEFPARVEFHFALPERNRPATVEHTIKLDRNYTGLQTLGSETVVDVWLYSTPDMLECEFKENIPMELPIDPQTDTETYIQPKDEISNEPIEAQDILVTPKNEPIELPVEAPESTEDSWLDFFSRDTTELDVDEMIIKPTKKVDERNDLESLIETNVIDKEIIENNHEEISSNENNVEVNNSVVNVNNERVSDSKIETEVPPMKVKSLHEDLPLELMQAPSPKKRIMKYMDPTTGKIYYLEMDRTLDLTKVQEIVINSKGNVKTAKISPIKANGLKNVRKNKKGGVSLLKPEVKSLLNKTELADRTKTIKQKTFTHIDNDHCYLKTQWPDPVQTNQNQINTGTNIKLLNSEVVIKKELSTYDTVCSALNRFTSVRVAVNYLLKKIPIISDNARDPDFVKCFPFVVENEERFWKMDFAKRRNIEWSRSKLINKLLTENFNTAYDKVWRTKQILIFSRLHGYYPIRTETMQKPTETDTNWSSWTDLETSRNFESNIKEIYPKAEDISSLTKFNADDYTNVLSESFDITESDDEVDIVGSSPVKVKKEVLSECSSNLSVLPVESDEDRMRFMFLERKCAEIGIELRNEDVGSGYSYSAVHAVLLSAMRSFAEELVRSSLAAKLEADAPQTVWTGSSTSRTCISLEHVYSALRNTRLQCASARSLGTERKDTYRI